MLHISWHASWFYAVLAFSTILSLVGTHHAHVRHNMRPHNLRPLRFKQVTSFQKKIQLLQVFEVCHYSSSDAHRKNYGAAWVKGGLKSRASKHNAPHGTCSAATAYRVKSCV
eukprot:5317483-Amphidinium_carterae.1